MPMNGSKPSLRLFCNLTGISLWRYFDSAWPCFVRDFMTVYMRFWRSLSRRDERVYGVELLCRLSVLFSSSFCSPWQSGLRTYRVTYYVVIPRSDHVLSFNTPLSVCLFFVWGAGARSINVSNEVAFRNKGVFFTNSSLSSNERPDCVSVPRPGFKMGVSKQPLMCVGTCRRSWLPADLTRDTRKSSFSN